MTNARTTNRGGWSLVELLVVLPLMTLLLSTSAMLLTAVFRSQRSLSSDIQVQISRARLGVQLRSDAHAAANVNCDTPQSCGFTLEGDETVHYEIREAALYRELRRGDSVLEREIFPLTGLRAEFSLDKSWELPLVRLSLESNPEPRKYSAVARSSLLEAAVGSGRERNSPKERKP